MSDIFSADLPSKKKHMRIGLAAVVLLSLGLYFLDSWIVDEMQRQLVLEKDGKANWLKVLGIMRPIVESLIAGSILTIVLATIFRWIVKYVDPRDRVIEISPGYITERLRENARMTSRYIFIGNTATFVTASVLPIVVDIAREDKQLRRVDLYIIDPMDEPSVVSYSLFKKQVSEENTRVGDQMFGKWVAPLFPAPFDTEPKVISKLIAAIYLAAYASVQSSMEVNVYLRRSFTPFRADITEREVVLTQESAKEAAVAFSASGDFYKWYHKEAAAQQNQAVKIDLTAKRSELLSLGLQHPGKDKQAIRGAMVALINAYPHLSSLSARMDVIAFAVDRVARPSHSY